MAQSMRERFVWMLPDMRSAEVQLREALPQLMTAATEMQSREELQASRRGNAPAPEPA